MPITETQIEALKAANPGTELTLIENAEFGVEFVTKDPKPGDFQAFRATQQGTDDLFAVNQGFAMNHVVSPSAAEVAQIFKRNPGLVEGVVKHLIKRAGARAEFTVKKL